VAAFAEVEEAAVEVVEIVTRDELRAWAVSIFLSVHLFYRIVHDMFWDLYGGFTSNNAIDM
jgi:hypothetical protein